MCQDHGQHLRRPRISRRDLLRYGVAGAGIAALGPFGGMLPQATGAPISGLKRLVIVNCYGGYDGLNLVVPITNNAYYNRRPTIQIDSANTLALTGTSDYALHPSLNRLAGFYNQGDAAIFRKVGYPTANLSHFTSQDIYSWGVRGDFAPLPIAESGWVARYASAHAQTPMGAAALGVGRPLDFEGGTTNPFMASSLATFDFQSNGLGTGDHQHRVNAAKALVDAFSGDGDVEEAAAAIGQGYDLAAQIQTAVGNYASSQIYPTNSPGIFLRDAAILIQGGFETEVFYTGFNGWDTHTNQGAEGGTQSNLMTRMDDAIGTFLDDLVEMGAYDDTVVLVISEFGRRNFENSSQGTDHGHGNMFFAVGGPVKQGLYGPDLTENEIATENWLDYDLDFRDVYKEAIGFLGGDPAAVFPEPQEKNNVIDYL